MTVSDTESDTDLVLVLDLGFPIAPELKHQLLHWSCLVAD